MVQRDPDWKYVLGLSRSQPSSEMTPKYLLEVLGS
jgi:hypothetical protein